MTGWHVTTEENWHTIQKEGLIPQIGPRSKKLREAYESIYLFNSLKSMENGIMNWLGDEFEEDEELVLLEVNLDNLPVDDVGYEFICAAPIPVEKIKFIKYI